MCMYIYIIYTYFMICTYFIFLTHFQTSNWYDIPIRNSTHHMPKHCPTGHTTRPYWRRLQRMPSTSWQIASQQGCQRGPQTITKWEAIIWSHTPAPWCFWCLRSLVLVLRRNEMRWRDEMMILWPLALRVQNMGTRTLTKPNSGRGQWAH